MSGAFSPRTRDDVRRLDGEISERFLTLFLDKCDADEALFFFACATPMIVSTFVFAASMPIDFIRSMFWRTRKSRAASYALTIISPFAVVAVFELVVSSSMFLDKTFCRRGVERESVSNTQRGLEKK